MKKSSAWQATAVPVHSDGRLVDGYNIDSLWFDAEAYHEGPCPWRNGDRISVHDAAKLVGKSVTECQELSPYWRVLVVYR